MFNWKSEIPLIVGNAIRTAVRAIMGIALVFLVLFIAWFSFEFLQHLKNLLARTIFSFDW